MKTEAKGLLKITNGWSDNSWNEEKELIELPIPLECPYCRTDDGEVGTWGWYELKNGKARRYRCKICKRTFNAAKIPHFVERMYEALWKVIELTIKGTTSINSLANILEVPESTLRNLVNELKDFLADRLERIKQLQEQLKP